jgi:glutamate racemase
MISEQPVGFFDSGIGGITVLKDAIQSLPNENYIYYGDNKNAPYGEKSEEQIQELTIACGEFLYNKGVKAIVIACNTATSAAVILMRQKYNIPVISMEPAVKPAVASLNTGNVLVLATPVTVGQQRYKQLLNTVGSTDKVFSVGCSGLVELIEKDIKSDAIDRYLEKRLEDYEALEIDAIVLGCTHYTFIKNKIAEYAQKHFKNNVVLFDGNAGTVRQLKHVLEERKQLNSKTNKGQVEFFTSGEDIHLFEKLLNTEE